MTTVFGSLLQTPYLLRTRRNHALEHATIHVLTEKKVGKPVAGHSDDGGFWLLGELSTEAVEQAVAEALQRLRAGETRLAIHPNCGTNLVTASGLAAVASGLVLSGANRPGAWLSRLPLAILASAVALIAARPLGARIQQHITTSAELGALQVLDIHRSQRGSLSAHRVQTLS